MGKPTVYEYKSPDFDWEECELDINYLYLENALDCILEELDRNGNFVDGYPQGELWHIRKKGDTEHKTFRITTDFDPSFGVWLP